MVVVPANVGTQTDQAQLSTYFWPYSLFIVVITTVMGFVNTHQQVKCQKRQATPYVDLLLALLVSRFWLLIISLKSCHEWSCSKDMLDVINNQLWISHWDGYWLLCISSRDTIQAQHLLKLQFINKGFE